jgi:triacylglycerol lipase
MITDPLQLKYPIVLIHGLGARSTYGPVEYFYGLSKLLTDARNYVFTANLTPWNTVDFRARQLKEQVETAIPIGKVNLVGHSMGGLDARYLASRLGFSERVASITTIGTPHRGTSVGDLAVSMVPAAAFTAADQILQQMDSSSSALKQITRSYCNGPLAVEAADMPGIAYYSATSVIASPAMTNALPLFWIPHRILKSLEGDNDGFVSVTSAQWGDHICTYSGDHYAQIGQFLGRARGMDYMQFYREIFRRLKKDGL